MRLDAPAHWVPHGRTVEQLLPAELAQVPLVVVDVSGPFCDADFKCTKADIEADERKNGPIPPGALVVIRFGWACRRYAHRDAYYNVTDWADVDPVLGLARLWRGRAEACLERRQFLDERREAAIHLVQL